MGQCRDHAATRRGAAPVSETTSAPANKAVAYQAKPKGNRKNKAVTRRVAKSAINRGLVSEKAAKRHLGDV